MEGVVNLPVIDPQPTLNIVCSLSSSSLRNSPVLMHTIRDDMTAFRADMTHRLETLEAHAITFDHHC